SQPLPVTVPAFGSYTTASTVRLSDRPSSSVTVTLIVYMPACANWCVRWQFESAAGKLSVVPSSQLTAQVCWSCAPGSVIGAVRLTVAGARNTCHGVGEVIAIDGPRFVACTVTSAPTGALIPSSAVSRAVKSPSSLQVTVVWTANASAKLHV